jgi:hypothetical protein
MRQIEHAGHAENQRKSGGAKRIQGPDREAID